MQSHSPRFIDAKGSLRESRESLEVPEHNKETQVTGFDGKNSSEITENLATWRSF